MSPIRHERVVLAPEHDTDVRRVLLINCFGFVHRNVEKTDVRRVFLMVLCLSASLFCLENAKRNLSRIEVPFGQNITFDA